MKVAVITGAAQGIGRRTAQIFAAAGYSLALLDLQPCTSTLASVRSTGVEAADFPGDISDEAIVAAENAGATVTKPPSAPAEFEGRHAYFADPEENYWEVVYLRGDGPGQQAIDRALGGP